MSAPDLGRRALTLGAGAFASIGLTAGAAATVADVGLPGPDAELIRLCGQFNALERKLQSVYDGANTPALEDWAESIAADVREQQEPLLGRICNARWSTMAGAVAIATSLHLWEAGEIDIEADDPEGNTNDRLLTALLRGLIGTA